MTAGDVQLDLFGEVLEAEEAQRQRDRAAEDARRQRDREKAAWRALFEPADWIAPWDCGDGTREGEAKPGWRCPDPDCGEVAPNAYLLRINHGWDPGVPEPGNEPGPGRRCWQVRHQASQEAANRDREVGEPR